MSRQRSLHQLIEQGVDEGLIAVLTRRNLAAYVGLSLTTIRELELAGQFPRRIALTKYRIGWLRTEVDVWIAKRARAPRLKGIT